MVQVYNYYSDKWNLSKVVGGLNEEGILGNETVNNDEIGGSVALSSSGLNFVFTNKLNSNFDDLNDDKIIQNYLILYKLIRNYQIHDFVINYTTPLEPDKTNIINNMVQW